MPRPNRWPCAVVLVAGLACAPSVGERDESGAAVEVEDVALPVDAELTLEDDVKGPKIVQGLGGVLPSDYPRDLPIHLPSSIVDFGRGAEVAFVEFESPTSKAAVAAGLRRRLAEAGWELTAGQGSWVATRDGRRARFELDDSGGGTRIRVEYR